MTAAITAWTQRFLGGFMALCLGACLLLTGCNASTTGLSGNYLEDTVAVADDPGRPEAESQARSLMTGYVARYRPRSAINGLGSFTTMQTAVNSLAGHYTNYPNRPLPDALKERLTKELKKAEVNVTRGA
jgi:photosystem II Psb27 protein